MAVRQTFRVALAIGVFTVPFILFNTTRIPDSLYPNMAAFHVDKLLPVAAKSQLTKEKTIQNIIQTHSNGSFLNFENGSTALKTLLEARCQDGYKVPPIVHYVWLSKETMEIHEYISVLSMSKFVKPCYILFHGDRIPAGKWWDRLLSEVHNIIHVDASVPETIFGRKIVKIQHKSDIVRLRVLLEYGGIYVDGDMYALRSFDPLRNFTMTMGREYDVSLLNSIILANKDSPFLKIWMLTYHMFNHEQWAFHSCRLPHRLQNILSPLLHVEENTMIGNGFSLYYSNLNWNESERYSIHLYIRWRFPRRDFEIEELKHMDNMYGSLSRFILFGKKDLIPK